MVIIYIMRHPQMYLVVSTDINFTTTVLTAQESREKAIAFLTSHIDDRYEPSKNNYKVSQKHMDIFEVHKIGYLYKSFICKIQIIKICDYNPDDKIDEN